MPVLLCGTHFETVDSLILEQTLEYISCAVYSAHNVDFIVLDLAEDEDVDEAAEQDDVVDLDKVSTNRRPGKVKKKPESFPMNISSLRSDGIDRRRLQPGLPVL